MTPCPVCRQPRAVYVSPGPVPWDYGSRAVTGGIASQTPGVNRAQVFRPLWDRLDDATRLAVLAHETAHAEADRDCEACADYGMGALLRRWAPANGLFSIDSFARLVPRRRVIRHAREGFHNAPLS